MKILASLFFLESLVLYDKVENFRFEKFSIRYEFHDQVELFIQNKINEKFIDNISFSNVSLLFSSFLASKTSSLWTSLSTSSSWNILLWIIFSQIINYKLNWILWSLFWNFRHRLQQNWYNWLIQVLSYREVTWMIWIILFWRTTKFSWSS